MLAMASNAQNDRIQAKEKRKKTVPMVTGPSVDASMEVGEFFPVRAVKVKQDDEISKRIKGFFSGLPSNPYSSPSQMPPRPPHSIPHGVNSGYQKSDGHGRPPPNHHIQQPPPSSQQAERDKTSGSKEQKKRSESSEHKHKHKDKKRKSAHSEERHSKKKSKSTDKLNSPPAQAKETSVFPPPKKISHRSSSVSSDRSDHSVKSRSSVDKPSSRHSNSHPASEHSSSKSKSKHSSSNSHQHSLSGSTTSSANQVTTATTTTTNASSYQQSSLSQTNSHSTHSTQGASHNYNKGAATYNSKSSSSAGSGNHDMALGSNESLFKNLTSAKSNSSAGKDRDARPPINGLARTGTKPTNLVIPSVHPSQSSSLKNDKGELAITTILAEMITPTEKITEIQTPCKADVVSPYPFTSLPKAIQPISNTTKSVKSNSKCNNNTEGKEKERSGSSKNSTLKPSKQTNGGVERELRLSLSASPSGSDSDSSGSSNSSDSSSSSSSSDSDSSDDEETPKPASVPPLLFNMERSPAPSAVHDEENSDRWDLGNFMPPSHKPAAKSTAPAKPLPNIAPQVSNSDPAPPKKKRGRPRKELESKKNPDPDFILPQKQPPTVASIVATDRKKRVSSSSKVKSSDSKEIRKPRGRPRKIRDDDAGSGAITSRTTLSSSLSSDGSSANNTPNLLSRSPAARSGAGSAAGSAASSSGARVASISSHPLPSWITDDKDEDVDVNVDVVSDNSPDSSHSRTSFKPVKSYSPVTTKTDPFSIESKAEPAFPKHEPVSPHQTYPKHEPISPADIKPQPSYTPGSASTSRLSTLPVSISLLKLPRPPSGSARPGKAENVKSEKISPPVPSLNTSKRRHVSPLSIIKAKQSKQDHIIKTDDSDITMDGDPVTLAGRRGGGLSSGSKDISRSTADPSTVPTYENSSAHHEKARQLKSQYVNMSMSSPNSRQLRNVICLESMATFMMCAICKEQEDPKGVSAIKGYYVSTLNLAESAFADVFKDSGSSQRSIHRCCVVLCQYVLAHLKHKCYKLLRDQATLSSKRIEEQLREKSRLAISPHSHPALPGNSPAAPSPASITSNGSMTSDSGRGNSVPPLPSSSVTVPESMLKDVGEYIKCMAHISSSLELWRTAHIMKDQPDCSEFFRQLDEDLGYSVTMLTDSKQFVHYIHTGCVRLKNQLPHLLAHSYL